MRVMVNLKGGMKADSVKQSFLDLSSLFSYLNDGTILLKYEWNKIDYI